LVDLSAGDASAVGLGLIDKLMNIYINYSP
jgi:hypothetical protein